MFWWKLLLMPALIGALTWAGRRWGPAVIGWLVGLPVVGGPILFFLAVEQGAAFAAQAAQGTQLGLVALSAYCVIYAHFSRRTWWGPSLAGGWTAYFAVAAALPWLPKNFLFSAAAGFAALAVAVRGFPRTTTGDAPLVAPPGEIVLRMAAAALLLVSITGAAGRIGPQWSGIFTPFPVFASVLPAFTHRGAGSDAAVKQLRGILLGLFSFAAFFAIVGVLVERSGIPLAFAAGAVCAVSIHGASLRRIRR